MTRRPPRQSVLDRPIARITALAVALAVAGLFLVIHWEDLFPPERQASQGDAAFRACMAKRGGDVERMLEEGVIEEDQAQIFRRRAEAFCRAQGEGGGPTLPGLPGQ